jgi:prepilin-type N-terminal cleavage/methylation domain-containing protein
MKLTYPQVDSSQRTTQDRFRAFTLIEVLIASSVLAVTLMGVLAICSNGLRIARALQHTHVDAGTVAAWTYNMISLTNRLEEGVDGGNFSEMVGDLYPDAIWQRQITEVGSNGLYRVDFLIRYSVEKKPLESQLSMLVYKPAGSPARR